jgi:transcriptional regulator with XRE-family HTH domain
MQSPRSSIGQPAVEARVTSCDGPAVGARLRQLRQSAGLTQAAVADRLGTTQSAVARLEGGQVRLSLATLQRTVIALGGEVQLVIGERKAG